MNTLAAMMRDMRQTRGLTLAQVALAANVSRSLICHAEAGRRTLDAATVARIDAAVRAGGALVDAWHTDDVRRREAARAGQVLAGSVEDSLLLMTADAGMRVVDLVEAAELLPVEYLTGSPGVMLEKAVSLRSSLLDVLRRGRFRDSEGASVQRGLSVASGMLSYAALDLGRPDVALSHIGATSALSQRLDDLEHLAWAAGTESLIRRFLNDFPGALAAIEGGLKLGNMRGTGRVRLLSGLGQCRANLGDAAGAHEALDWAARARERVTIPDSVGGIYGFTEAKQTYYIGSSLIHLRDDVSSRRAIHGAQQAIDEWTNGGDADPLSADVILSRLYQAIAYLNLGDLAGVVTALESVISTPPSERTSWVTKRLGDITTRLASPPWDDSAEAADLRRLITAH